MRLTRSTEVWMRLGLGIALNAALLTLPCTTAFHDSAEGVRVELIVITIASMTLVGTIPIFWRGKPWQAPIAFVLLWLPALVLLSSV